MTESLDSGRYILILLAAFAGGAVNSIAGGGTLLTFPALLGLGVRPIVANATSTVALWPGQLASIWGYRGALSGSWQWAKRWAIPSTLGGFTGAFLLLVTPPDRFEVIVPWLVLGATLLFAIQKPVMRWLGNTHTAEGDGATSQATSRRAPIHALLYQFGVGVYGGYFGAGIGILMLAVLGYLGFSNIHRMNGLKNWGGLCINAAAVLTFAFSSIVHWPVALTMALGSMAGGYFAARTAQRVPQKYVRQAITLIGFACGIWLLFDD
ncbi:MAG TPA: sulfite exporter TauE/SafE family protein [Gemmatimonadaceae bacterium]|nr:sulfite exporter TauE/SafE family protein [Gemmatimonadaceae bacterium]